MSFQIHPSFHPTSGAHPGNKHIQQLTESPAGIPSTMPHTYGKIEGNLKNYDSFENVKSTGTCCGCFSCDWWFGSPSVLALDLPHLV